MLPSQLTYQTDRPQGFPQVVKDVIFTPIQTTNYYYPNEWVRWEIRSNGYLDPHTTRLSFEVECDDLSHDEIRRLDNSAHSFFTELRIQVRGVEIETIRELDTLSVILHDLNWNANDRRGKIHEGHGISDLSYGEFQNMQNNVINGRQFKDSQFQPVTYDPTNPMHDPAVAMTSSAVSSDRDYPVHLSYTYQNLFDFYVNRIYLPGMSNSIRQFGLTNSNNKANVNVLLQTGVQISSNIGYGTYEQNRLNMQDQDPRNKWYVQGDGYPFGIYEPDISDLRIQQGTIYQFIEFSKGKSRWTFQNLYKASGYFSGYEKDMNQGSYYTLHMATTGTGNNNPLYYKTVLQSMTRFIDNNPAVLNAFVNEFGSIRSIRKIFAMDNIEDMNNASNAQKLQAGFMQVLGGVYDRQIKMNNNTLGAFLNNAYYKTLPWSLIRNENSLVYEYAKGVGDLMGYEINKQIKPYYGIGDKKIHQIEYNHEGYIEPYNPIFATGSDEFYFAGDSVPVKRLFKGRVINQMGRKYASFTIPFLSAIFGILQPPDQYKFIPMNIMEDLVIELRLNPHALFSSGYKSTYLQDDYFRNEIIDIRANNGIYHQVQQNTRGYKIKRIELLADLYSFTSAIDRSINDQWQSDNGIVFQTQGWNIGPETIFQTTKNVQGTHQINYSFNSLKCIFWRFYPLDYEKYSFCRKHFSINHCLRSYKLQLGQDYYPMDGVRGCAGTPFGEQNDRYGSNKEFYNQMLKAFGKLHDMKGNITINPINWAVNDRCYDPTKRGSYYICGAFDQQQDVRYEFTYANTSQFTTNYVQDYLQLQQGTMRELNEQFNMLVYNGHTALQLPGFHECRVIGKCLFALDLEAVKGGNRLGGLNTYDYKPFNIIFEVDGDENYHFKRASKMILFFWYDMVVQLKSGMSPIVIGRA